MPDFDSLPRPAGLLDSAAWAIRQASLRLCDASAEGAAECVPLLEDALRSVETFSRDMAGAGCGEPSGMAARAEELRDSLMAFLALASQLRAYYDSLSAEIACGQLSYTASALTSLGSAVSAPAFAEW